MTDDEVSRPLRAALDALALSDDERRADLTRLRARTPAKTHATPWSLAFAGAAIAAFLISAQPLAEPGGDVVLIIDVPDDGRGATILHISGHP